MTFKPWTFFMVAIAGWMNRQQAEVIEYLRQENRILREKLGPRRIILNDSQRRRLAQAAIKVGRDLLYQFGTLFTPETLLTWHRKLIARKYDGSGMGHRVLCRIPTDAVDDTASFVYENAQACVRSLNECPGSPFSEDLIREMTVLLSNQSLIDGKHAQFMALRGLGW